MPPFANMKIYGTTTINDKGQIVIPAEARAELGLEPGSRMMVLRGSFGNGVAIIKTEAIEAQMQSWNSALAAPQANEQNEGKQ